MSTRKSLLAALFVVIVGPIALSANNAMTSATEVNVSRYKAMLERDRVLGEFIVLLDVEPNYTARPLGGEPPGDDTPDVSDPPSAADDPPPANGEEVVPDDHSFDNAWHLKNTGQVFV